MFYIIDNTNHCIACCDKMPDESDLKSRDEFSIESQEIGKIGSLYIDKHFHYAEKTDSEKLSEFLKSVSTTIDYVGSIGLQCYMAGIDFPADWKAYRTELIALSKVSEYSDNLVLPTQPPLPSNI